MKTIKEIADELGVSKQAVRNEIEKQGLQSKLAKSANRLCVSEDAESLIKAAFSERRAGENRKPQTANEKAETQTLFAIIEKLQEENAELLKQNAALTATIESLSGSLQAAQALHAGTMQERLESKKEPEPVEEEQAAAGKEPKEKESQEENPEDKGSATGAAEVPRKRRWWEFWKA